MSVADPSHVLTVGHSNHSLEHFLSLLHGCQAEVLADVRSYPYSKYAPQFDVTALKESVGRAGMKFVFLGRELGGRPDGAEFYDAEGHVLYGRVAEAQFFREGLARVLRGLEEYRVALLCAEEGPRPCHRRLLIGRVLAAQGVTIEHIRGDGKLQTEHELAAIEARQRTAQASLFEQPRETPWRSTQSVLHRGRLRPSSEP